MPNILCVKIFSNTLTLLLTHSHCATELEAVQYTECDVTVA